MLKLKLMLINALEVLCIESLFSVANLICSFHTLHLAHLVLCSPAHLNISGFAPGPDDQISVLIIIYIINYKTLLSPSTEEHEHTQ